MDKLTETTQKERIISGRDYQLRELQPFTCKAELNMWERVIKYNFKHSLSKSILKVLDFILDWSVKYCGVFYMKYPKAMELLAMAKRTFYRALDKLENELGIIERITRYTENGKEAGKIIVLKPVESVDNLQELPQQQPEQKQNGTPNGTPKMAPQEMEQMPWESKDETPQNEGDTMFLDTTLSKDAKKNIKQSTEYTENSYIPSYVPKTFVHCLSFTNTFEMVHFWKTFHNEWEKRPRLVHFEQRKEDIAKECGQAYFYSFKEKQSKGEQVENTGGLFCGIAKNILDDYEREAAAMEMRERVAAGADNRWAAFCNFLKK